MKKHLYVGWGFVLAAVLAVVLIDRASAQTPAGATFDEAAAPGGANYDKAEFRMWYPSEVEKVRAVVVLVPGSNGDWRNQVDDVGGGGWREFAARNKVALVGVRFTDKPHDQSFIEEYANAARGTGQALLDALSALAAKSKHPEVATAPLLLWGMSAGGQFNYEFVGWKPERVAAFVVNKGGIYYSALLPAAARAVPGMFFVGGKDLEFRTQTIVGLFAVNRRAGALWALAEEPGIAHVVGRSSDVTKVFFEDVLNLRDRGAIAEKDGFIGDLKAKTFQPAATAPANATIFRPSRTAATARAQRARRPDPRPRCARRRGRPAPAVRASRSAPRPCGS
jgi:dienelactone hydrolase